MQVSSIFLQTISEQSHTTSACIEYRTIRQGQVQDRIDINSTLSQEVRFTLQQDTDALYFQDRPILQDNNTLLRPLYTTIVRFYVEPKYVYTADIFILICICYIFCYKEMFYI